MKLNKGIGSIFGIFVCLIALNGCASAVPKNPIFSGTQLIDINQPEGSGATASPTFIWTATGKAYEVVGVFNTTISVTGKNIDNTNNCIAMWTTGMSGSAGNVPFSNFKQVVNGNLTSNSTNNLNNGTYHWAVWAYDDTETVVSSSADITFTAP